MLEKLRTIFGKRGEMRLTRPTCRLHYQETTGRVDFGEIRGSPMPKRQTRNPFTWASTGLWRCVN